LNPQLYASIPPSKTQNRQQKMTMSSTASHVRVIDNPDHIRKIEYLEQELKKAQEMNVVYQRKWEKLKETAKKKRESKGSNSELMVSTSPFPVISIESTPTELPPKSPKSASSRSSQQTTRPLSPTLNQSMYFSVHSNVHSHRLP
jgi:hypothetical protein